MDHDDADRKAMRERTLVRRWRPSRARYSDKEKRLALSVVYFQGDCERAAAALDIPARTLRAWRSGRGVHPTVYAPFGDLFGAAPWRGKTPSPA